MGKKTGVSTLATPAKVGQCRFWFGIVWNAWYGMAMKYSHLEFSLKYAKVTKNIIAIAHAGK